MVKINEGVSAFAVYSGQAKELEMPMQPLSARKASKRKFSLLGHVFDLSRNYVPLVEQGDFLMCLIVYGRCLQPPGTYYCSNVSSCLIVSQTQIFAYIMDQNEESVQPSTKQASKKKLKKKAKKILEGELQSAKSTVEESTDDTSAVPAASPESEKEPSLAATEGVEDLSTVVYDSLVHSEQKFAWLIAPSQVENFFRDYFEKQPMLTQRDDREYYRGFLSLKELDVILRQKDVRFGVNLDVTRYEDGERETFNPDGRAYAPLVWDFVKDGCSIRMMNPQSYSDAIYKLCSELHECFGTFVGANLYLTPAGTQGFAPHFDDVEVFVMQLEGGKRWKVYEPRTPEEELPKFSSPNFDQEEIGEPVIEVELRPGDLLYLPRGYVHQAESIEDCHSLHLTISTTQCNTWGDLLKKALNSAVDTAMATDVEFRKSLPRHYLNSMGVLQRARHTEERSEFKQTLERLCGKLAAHIDADMAVDETAKEFIATALPPVLTEAERPRTVRGSFTPAPSSSSSGFSPAGPDQITGKSEVKLLRRNICRVCLEGLGVDGESVEALVLYHCLENTSVYKERELLPSYLPPAVMQAFSKLVTTYPDFVMVKKLPGEKNDNVDLVELLFDKGLIMLKPK